MHKTALFLFFLHFIYIPGNGEAHVKKPNRTGEKPNFFVINLFSGSGN
uniref:Uncharacterized protein n=1 Tax=Anguilla anguilla TaxID=7936 RepID=A0A0E9QSZ6_ANGAN